VCSTFDQHRGPTLEADNSVMPSRTRDTGSSAVQDTGQMTEGGAALDRKPRRGPLGLIVGGGAAAAGLVVALVVRDKRRKERERLEALAAAAAAAAARRRLWPWQRRRPQTV